MTGKQYLDDLLSWESSWDQWILKSQHKTWLVANGI